MLEKKIATGCADHDYCSGWNDAVDAIPRWISVEERKPKVGQHCLCICAYENDPRHEWDSMMVLRWMGDCDNGYVNRPHFQHEGMEGMKVTHWMSLPEPPEESP